MTITATQQPDRTAADEFDPAVLDAAVLGRWGSRR